MPLSYCSIACAIQPTVRPTRNSASALPSGSPSAVTAAPSAKSTFGCWPVSCFAADAAAAMRAPQAGRARADRRDDRAGARIAVGIERMAKPGRSSPRASRAAMTGIGSALSPISSNSASARADWPPCRRPTTRRAPPRRPHTASRRSRRRHGRQKPTRSARGRPAAPERGGSDRRPPRPDPRTRGELPVHRIGAGSARSRHRRQRRPVRPGSRVRSG